MKKMFFSLAILFFAGCVSAAEDEISEAKALREDIQILNLLNGLDLKPEQMQFILGKAREVGKIRNDSFQKISERKSEIVQNLSAIRDQVGQGRTILEDPDKQRFERNRKLVEDTAKEAETRLDGIADEVEAKLLDFQKCALEAYKPCIVPRVSQNRIGQAEPGQGVAKGLERIQAMPAAKYEKMKDRIMNQVLEKVRDKLPPALEYDEKDYLSKIESVFNEVRSMDAPHFRLEKDAISEKLANQMLPLRKKGTSEKIKKLLLSERIIPILEEKLKH
ncbi:MAG: hypothetical protein PHW04_03685 [Candidatus Wallbacteria bacterium]|nr:hypothetical protein [Candidatus Wallbacteria bacterium]